MSEPSLAERFETLAKAATPGPWLVNTEDDGPGVACIEAPNAFVADEPIVADTYGDDIGLKDAAFIAFCGTHRDEIAAKMRVAQSVRDQEHDCCRDLLVVRSSNDVLQEKLDAKDWPPNLTLACPSCSTVFEISRVAEPA